MQPKKKGYFEGIYSAYAIHNKILSDLFDGIKLVHKQIEIENGFKEIDTVLVVPNEKFLKIQETSWGLLNSEAQEILCKFFGVIVELNKANEQFIKSNFYIRTYSACMNLHFHYDEDFEFSPFIVQENSWWDVNMQIASLTIALKEITAYRVEIWEDNFAHARYTYPSPHDLLFSDTLSRDELFIHGHEVDLASLKNLLLRTREYNQALLLLAEQAVNAAPIALTDPLMNELAKTKSLLDLFPREQVYD